MVSKRGRHRPSVLETRLKILDLLGGKCMRCGFSDFRALQVDHVNGGGSAAYRAGLFRDAFSRLREIQEHPEQYQLLCANCNWIKRYMNGEHN